MLMKNIYLKFLRDKKGSLTDSIFTTAYILKVSATILIALFVWFSFQTLFAQIIVGSPAETTINNVMNTLRSAYLSMDYVFPILVGGLLLVSTVFAFKTGTNLVWGILSLIIWGIALLLGALFKNVYIQVADAFPTVYPYMPIMDAIMTNLNWLVLFWLAIISAVMFRKNNVEDDLSENQRRFYGK